MKYPKFEKVDRKLMNKINNYLLRNYIYIKNVLLNI